MVVGGLGRPDRLTMLISDDKIATDLEGNLGPSIGISGPNLDRAGP